MSDSENVTPQPSDAQLTSTVKRIVGQFYKLDRDNLTVKRVRKAVEDDLDLPSNWLKEHDTWAAKSKDLITSEAERLETAGSDGGDEDEAPVGAKKPQKNKKEANGTAANAKKRKSAGETAKAAKAKPKPRKKRKVSSDEEDEAEESEALSSLGEDNTPSPAARRTAAKPKPKPAQKGRPKKVIDSEDEDNDGDVKMDEAPAQDTAKQEVADEDEDNEPSLKPAAPPVQADGNDSESSMSSLLDEPPTKKKRQKKSPASKTAKSKTSKSASKSKSSAKPSGKDLSPSEEEIKRLQGWLLKCGIRKVWGRELKPFETDSAKIAHLKGMLSDAGMTGRFSVEKAARIKERRELAADLEAVTAFEEKWGNKEEEGPKRRGDMARSLGLDPSMIEGGSDDDDED